MNDARRQAAHVPDRASRSSETPLPWTQSFEPFGAMPSSIGELTGVAMLVRVSEGRPDCSPPGIRYTPAYGISGRGETRRCSRFATPHQGPLDCTS